MSTAGDLAAFVPRLTLELGERDGSHWTNVEGSMLSADISGFTALSEKLAGKGKSGAEEITQLVNDCFVALIDAAYGFNGEVLKFGGDAILVLFRGDQHEARCGHAAIAMQAALRSTTAARRANLSMSIGASVGPFDVFLVGTQLREMIVTGRGSTEVVRLEGAAARGETLVSRQLASMLDPGLRHGEHDDGVVIVGDYRALEPIGRTRQREVNPGELTPFVPPQVVSQLDAFQHLGGEHRLVTVGFAMVTGISPAIAQHGLDATTSALGTFIDEAILRSAPFGVTMLHSDIATDGFKCVLAAGAPINPGDTSDAMLQAALAIADIDVPFDVRVGVQTGRVFAGFLGASYRRTYTVMGDPVNTAARLLGIAENRQVIATADVVDDTRTVFETRDLPLFAVKGKTEPIQASRVMSTTSQVRRAASSTALHGRQNELAVLSRAVGELGETVDVVGPAGLGKSRLVDAAWDASEGLTTFRGACTPYGAATPYGVFQAVLRSGTGIDPNASPEAAGALLTSLIGRVAPDLAPMLPLLAVPFGAEVDSTPESDAVEDDFRRLRIHETVLRFFDAVLTGPVLLVMEDMQWVDEASGDLANFLLRATVHRSWTAIITRRPAGDWVPDPELDNVVTLEIEPLREDDVRALCIETCSRALSDAELDALVARADGNPLFAIELARAAAAASSIDDVPDSVEAVIAARIDNLDPEQRRLVRTAAVFGNRFSGGDLNAVLSEEDVDARLRGDRVEDILERDADGWAFTHALYRDVAYEGLPYQQRQHLHGVIGDTLVGRLPEPSLQAALLALHFSEAGRRAETWHYGVLAGRRARERYAYAEAAVSLERAVEAGRRLRSVEAAERSSVGAELGDALLVVGRFKPAKQAFQAARKANTSVATEVDLMRRIGVVMEREGNMSGALSWFTRALDLVPANTSDPGELSARAQALLAKAGIMHRRREHHAAARVSHEALADAERAQDDASRAVALERLHVCHVFTGSRYAELYGTSALEAYEQLGNRNGTMNVLNNFGVQRYFNSDWTGASEFYRRTADEAEVAGNVILAGTAALNSGEILSDQGHWDAAIDLFDAALRNWSAVGYPTGLAAARLFKGVALTRKGEFAEARTLLTDALEQLRSLTIAELIADGEIRLLELDVVANEPGVIERARRLLDRFDDQPDAAARVRRVLGLALADAGQLVEGREQLDAALASVDDDSIDQAVTMNVLATLWPDDPAATTWVAVRDATFARLGVVGVTSLDSFEPSK